MSLADEGSSAVARILAVLADQSVEGEAMTQFLETPEDLEWLRDTHLKGCIVPPFEVASLEGNEDWPTKITLYEVNHVNSLTLDLIPDAEGVFHCRQDRY
jgi:hypothetical protein